jgi:hypothetical protein
MVCYATYTFTQERYEAGQLQLQASAKPSELNAPVTSGQATVTTTYLQQLQYHPGACTLPESRKLFNNSTVLFVQQLAAQRNTHGM